MHASSRAWVRVSGMHLWVVVRAEQGRTLQACHASIVIESLHMLGGQGWGGHEGACMGLAGGNSAWLWWGEQWRFMCLGQGSKLQWSRGPWIASLHEQQFCESMHRPSDGPTALVSCNAPYTPCPDTLLPPASDPANPPQG